MKFSKLNLTSENNNNKLSNTSTDNLEKIESVENNSYNNTNALELAEQIEYILGEKLAENIKIIKVDNITTITDFFVLATAKSSTHLKILAEDVEEVLSKKQKIEPFGKELTSDDWRVLDYNSVIVHIFIDEVREFYNLERLWQNI